MKFLIPLIILFITSCVTPKTDYDVVIVGGGLAGLSAANELNSKNVLVVEKDSILGGRVRTHNYQNKYFYDLGAVFALDKKYRYNFDITYNEITEDKEIGFWYNNILYKGNTVYDCVKQIPKIDSKLLKEVSASNTLTASKLPPNLYSILNTNMKAVFPGALDKYNTTIQHFALERYNSSHFRYGNGVIVENFLKDKKYKVQTSSKVIGINDLEKYVQIIILNNNKLDTITSKKVIVATTATVAKKIINKIDSSCRNFLNGIYYAGYYSIAVGVSKKLFVNDVSYLMPINSGFSSILKQKTVNPNFTIFQLYIAEEDFKLFKDDEDRKNKSINILRNIWNISDSNVVFYDQYYWKEAGVLVNDHYLQKWSNENLKASKNVALAGDYCLTQYNMPYGMIPAIESGKNAVKLIKN